MAHALSAGAQLLKQPHETFYGGYTGYFTDPDGHPGRSLHNPGFDVQPTTAG